MSFGITSTGFREKRPHGYQKFAMRNFTPEQMELYRSLFSNVGEDSYLSRLAGGDEDMFNEIEAPALKQFSGLLGGIGSRFSGMGMGARNSSGFQNTTTQAAQDFAGQLQSQRQGLQRQALMDLMNISNVLLSQRPFEQGYAAKKQRGGMGDVIGQLAGAAPSFFSLLM